MINFKQGIILFLIAIFLAMTSAIVLADSPDYDIIDVQINDITLGSSKLLDIERTDSITVEIELKALNSTPDVRVEAEIEGYEFGDIKDKSDIFDMESNVTYKKTLKLDIPDDLQASKTYTLRVEVSDPKNQEILEVKLNIDEKRHFLRIFDVIVRPQGKVEAGKPVFATVRVENLGEKKERDVEVRVSIPELGVTAREYIDELVSELEERITVREDEESSASTNEILLRIPDDAKTGSYDMLVEVIYNRGHSKVVQRVPLNVEGTKKLEQTPLVTETTIVSIDGTSKTVKAGQEVPFKVMFANLDNAPRVYTVEILGTQLFADSRVDPGFITVQPGKTGEAFVFLNVKPNAETKKQFFTVRALSGTNLIKEISLTADVQGKSVSNWSWLGSLFWILFGVLVIVLIALLIVYGVKRMNESNEDYTQKTDDKPLEPSPSTAEGQSYYYYPKQ